MWLLYAVIALVAFIIVMAFSVDGDDFPEDGYPNWDDEEYDDPKDRL